MENSYYITDVPLSSGMISAQIRYAIAATPKEQSARIAQITLTTVASMLK